MPNEFVIRNGYISSGDSVVSTRLGVGFTPDSTTRLDVRAQGSLSSDVAFRVRNSANTANIASVSGNGDIAIGLRAVGVDSFFSPGFVVIGTDAKTSQYGLSIGHSAGKNQDGGDRRNVYIGGNVASVGTNQTNAYNVGIGSNALMRVTSGSQNVAIGSGYDSNTPAGAQLTTANLCTLIGHSSGGFLTTGTANTLIGGFSGSRLTTGVGNTMLGFATGLNSTAPTKSHNVQLGMRLDGFHDGNIMIGSSGDLNTNANSLADDSAQFHFRSLNQSFFFNKNTNVVLRSDSALTSGTHFEAAAKNVITIHNGTAPVANIADATAFYSADIVAGNAAPHFRTENGSIIKLYQQSATTTTQGLADTLTNLGFLVSGSTIETIDQLQVVLNSQVYS